LGSTDGVTEYLAMDMDSSYNAIIAGYSTSSNLVSTSSMVPIYVKLDVSTGDYLWNYYFSNLNGKIVEVKYQNIVYTSTAMIFWPYSTT
jgi:hypothetical protein